MKKLIKKVICIILTGLMVMGNICNTVEAEVIQGTKGRTYITMDKIERDENKMVIKYLGIKNPKIKYDKKTKTYTVEFKTNKSCKETKKLVKNICEKLHGTEIEKLFKEYRTYNVKVVAKMKGKNHTHSYYIKGHKIK